MAESDWVDVQVSESDWVDVDQTRQLKTSTQETLAQQEVARQAIIQRAQRPASQKVFEAAGAIPSAVIDLGSRLLGGIPQIPTVLSQPQTIIPTVAEAGRRTGVDLVRLGEMLRPKTVEDVRAMGMGPIAVAINQISKLSPRTPTEAEIESELSGIPLLGRAEDVSREREQIAFEGANPQLSESLSQAIQLASPIKGIQSLKTIPSGISGLGRAVRTAIKPTKGVVGAKLEKAAASEVPDIFLRNPNADKFASGAFEGFANEVSGAFKEAGDKLSELRALSGTTLNSGDELADKILSKAVDLEKAGQPRSVIEELTNRAEDIRGRLSDINSLQDAVTIANRKPNILKPKTTAEGFSDEIISRDGGSLINKELESVGGEAGNAARKKWANLKLLNDNVQERVNKIINSAPKDAPPAVIEALSSVQGAAGLFALLNGYISAAPGLIASGIRSWAKREAKALKDSNVIIERKYEELRRNPPSSMILPGAQPPPIPSLSDQIELQIQ